MALFKGPNSLEQQYFRAQKANINSNFSFGKDQLNADRAKAGWTYGTQREDVTRQYGQQRRAFAGGWNGRGRFGGGAYQRAVRDLAADKGRTLDRLSKARTYQNEGFNMAGNQLYRAKNLALWNLGDQQTALTNHLLAQDLIDGR